MKKVNGIKAVGTTVLVEMATVQEDAGSALAVIGKPKQGRIVDIGPAMMDSAKYGFAKGDRVLLQGTFTPVPKFPGVVLGSDETRDLVVVDPHMIKCVFTEEEEVVQVQSSEGCDSKCVVSACPPKVVRKGKKKSSIA